MSKEEIEMLEAHGELIRLIRGILIAHEKEWISTSDYRTLLRECVGCIAEIEKKDRGEG